jgi:hypothetical protein
LYQGPFLPLGPHSRARESGERVPLNGNSGGWLANNHAKVVMFICLGVVVPFCRFSFGVYLSSTFGPTWWFSLWLRWPWWGSLSLFVDFFKLWDMGPCQQMLDCKPTRKFYFTDMGPWQQNPWWPTFKQFYFTKHGPWQHLLRGREIMFCWPYRDLHDFEFSVIVVIDRYLIIQNIFTYFIHNLLQPSMPPLDSIPRLYSNALFEALHML